MNDDQVRIETGAEGEPIVHVTALHRPAPAPPRQNDVQVEVIPGIMVSQVLIDEAVRLTSRGESPATNAGEKIKANEERTQRENEEMRRDIDAGRNVVNAMLTRMHEPIDDNERFVSFDNMPAPLQRVIKAYIEAEAANRELNEAIVALGKNLHPPMAQAA